MTKTIAILTEVSCDVCNNATAVVDARNHATGKPVRIVGMKKPNTKGWLILPEKFHGTGVHVCPGCLAAINAAK
ncbi:MAG: hypothetical protein QM813_09355 [Verrucomicrobiota bacterium]